MVQEGGRIKDEEEDGEDVNVNPGQEKAIPKPQSTLAAAAAALLIPSGSSGEAIAANDNNNNNSSSSSSNTLLVSEFPPPPFYYPLAAACSSLSSSSSSSSGHSGRMLPPPPIPQEALTRGTLQAKAAAAANRARAEAERQLQISQISQSLWGDGNDQQLSQPQPQQMSASTTTTTTTTGDSTAGVDRQSGDIRTGSILRGVAGVLSQSSSGACLVDNEGDTVAVFGEIVEDPWLVEPLDPCDDPTVVRDKVKELNQKSLQLFVQLLHDLVHRPTENKTTRNELFHTIHLMLQECNKFREHQAREILIDLLEKQLAQRERLIEELQHSIDYATSHVLQLQPAEPAPAPAPLPPQSCTPTPMEVVDDPSSKQ